MPTVTWFKLWIRASSSTCPTISARTCATMPGSSRKADSGKARNSYGAIVETSAIHVGSDLVLHIKTSPDIGNQLHLFTPYEDRIQLTYLRGKQETPLVRLNRKDADAPTSPSMATW